MARDELFLKSRSGWARIALRDILFRRKYFTSTPVVRICRPARETRKKYRDIKDGNRFGLYLTPLSELMIEHCHIRSVTNGMTDDRDDRQYHLLL